MFGVYPNAFDLPSLSFCGLNDHSNITFSPQIVDELPAEILTYIFHFLLILDKNWNAPSLTCKRWRILFDDNHPLKILKRADFKPSLINCLISGFAKTHEALAKIHSFLATPHYPFWMDQQIKTCEEGATKKAIFILENMWLTSFNTETTCSNSSVQEFLSDLKELNITQYQPEVDFKQVIEQLKECRTIPIVTLIEGLRLGYLSLADIPNRLRTQKYLLKECLNIPTAILIEGLRLGYLSLADIPNRLHTQNFLLTTVQNDASTLQQIPEAQRTTEICLAAVQQEKEWAYLYVPKAQRTTELFLAASKNNMWSCLTEAM